MSEWMSKRPSLERISEIATQIQSGEIKAIYNGPYQEEDCALWRLPLLGGPEVFEQRDDNGTLLCYGGSAYDYGNGFEVDYEEAKSIKALLEQIYGYRD